MNYYLNYHIDFKNNRSQIILIKINEKWNNLDFLDLIVPIQLCENLLAANLGLLIYKLQNEAPKNIMPLVHFSQ